MFTRNTAKALIYSPSRRRILLTRGIIPSKPWDAYDLPGGGIHRNESAHDAVVREVHEELGLEIDDYQTIMEIPTPNITVRQYAWIMPLKANVKLFWITLKEKVELNTGWEISETRWVRPDDLPLLLDPAYNQLLDDDFFEMLQ